MSDLYYEQPELWGQKPEPYQIQVLADILSLIPDDVANLLDVGCGDGFITQVLAKRLQVVGVDTSWSALCHFTGTRSLGQLPHLPFADRAFDLVMANDILEHLPETVLDTALGELCRVARKYLLITVPFAEDLSAREAKCAACGAQYHVNRHQRRFSLKDMEDLFGTEVQVLERRLSGDLTRPPVDPTTSLRQMIGLFHVWPQAICPNCGSKQQCQAAEMPLTLRLLDVSRSILWYRRLRESGPWSIRTEVVGLYAFNSTSRIPNASPPALSRLASALIVDFANPLQAAASGLTAGMPWARFQSPQPGERSAMGLTVRSGFVEVVVPTEAEIGDKVQITACSLDGPTTIGLYGLDGGTGLEIFLGNLSVSSDWTETLLILERSWLPERFGLMLRVYPSQPIIIRYLAYIPRDPERNVLMPFVPVGRGHNRVTITTDEGLISWGFWADQPGEVPCPELTMIDIEEALTEKPLTSSILPLVLNICEQQSQQLWRTYHDLLEVLMATRQQCSAAHECLEELRAKLNSSAEALAESRALVQHLTTTLKEAQTEAQRLAAILQKRSGWRWVFREALRLLGGHQVLH